MLTVIGDPAPSMYRRVSRPPAASACAGVLIQLDARQTDPAAELDGGDE